MEGTHGSSGQYVSFSLIDVGRVSSAYTSTINPLAPNCDGSSVWKFRGTSAKKLAQETTANHAINPIYYCDFDIKLIDAWRICPAKRNGISYGPPAQQKQYHTHYGPMITEKWALPFFRKSEFQPASIRTAARTYIECTCWQKCNYPRGLEPKNSETYYLHMYICDACQCTYHWKLSGCYTDEQKQEVQIAETLACPTCAGLSN
eukprot:777881-Pelagomonas_calceolata.AAC.1